MQPHLDCPTFKSCRPYSSFDNHDIRLLPLSPSSHLLSSPIAVMAQHSDACCRIPPIVAKDYQPKGEYITVNGLKTCNVPSKSLLCFLSFSQSFSHFYVQ
jgi:hypothetical protein